MQNQATNYVKMSYLIKSFILIIFTTLELRVLDVLLIITEQSYLTYQVFNVVYDN